MSETTDALLSHFRPKGRERLHNGRMLSQELQTSRALNGCAAAVINHTDVIGTSKEGSNEFL
jgi:hypothetical protein